MAEYKVKDFFEGMDGIAPFAHIDPGDNSGLIVGYANDAVTHVLTALDISMEVVAEAVRKKCSLIISHHPVIYNPLYTLSTSNPAGYALANGIACICSHSPLDMADGGINDIIYDMLKEPLGLSEKLKTLEPVHADGRGYGMICNCSKELYPDELAALLKKLFRCTVVRYTDAGVPVKRIAFCSGGGGKLYADAFKLGCDAYVSGDFKHDQFVYANNMGISVYDCGHFHTEDIVIPYITKRLSEMFPEVRIEQAEADVDPVNYI